MVFAKVLCPVCAMVLCHQQLDPNETEERAEVKIRAFNSSVGLHQNYCIDKSFWQEEYICCEVKQETDELFVHPIKFFCIL